MLEGKSYLDDEMSVCSSYLKEAEERLIELLESPTDSDAKERAAKTSEVLSFVRGRSFQQHRRTAVAAAPAPRTRNGGGDKFSRFKDRLSPSRAGEACRPVFLRD